MLKEDYNINRLRSLILINDNFDTLNFSRNIPKKSKSIYKDCIGNLHILTNDSAYQIIFLKNTGIAFYQPIDLKKFNLVLKNCLFETDSLIFFRNEIRAGFGEEYFTVNKNDNSINTFLKVLDTSNLINYINNCSSISRKYWSHEIPAASVESDSILLDNIRSFEIEDRFLNDIATEKLSNKLISKNDTVIFFNNINSHIQIFSPKLETVKLIKTKYSKNNGWVGNIIKDEITNKTYTFYKTNGFYSIYEILVSDGSIQKIRDIPFIVTNQCQN